MMGLDVDVPRHFLHSLKHLQLVWIHFWETWAKSEVPVDLLESIESAVQDCEASFKHRAVTKALNVPGMDGVRKAARLRARVAAGYTNAIFNLQQDKIEIN